MRIWIKICATTSVEDALAAIDAGADALGFVFAPSKRQVTPEQVRAIAERLPAKIERVGVFQDETPDRVRAAVEMAGLTAVQLHGNEGPEYIAELFRKGPRTPRIGIIKTIVVKDDFAARLAQVYRGRKAIDSLLLDAGAGSGQIFDWQAIKPQINGHGLRLIVAGGLRPDNVGEAIKTFTPWGVDVVTGVEREAGRKDPEKMKAFVAAVRRAERS